MTDKELIAELRQVLEDNMYMYLEYDGGFICVACGSHRSEKHKPDCEIARVLSVRST